MNLKMIRMVSLIPMKRGDIRAVRSSIGKITRRAAAMFLNPHVYTVSRAEAAVRIPYPAGEAGVKNEAVQRISITSLSLGSAAKRKEFFLIDPAPAEYR